MTERRHFNARDEKGWRIPREGTIARRVYDLAEHKFDRNEIAERIGRTPNYVSVVLWKLANSDRINAYKHRKPEKEIL